MSPIPVLYDQDTLLHHSIELIGHKLIDAHESPDRIRGILRALESSDTSLVKLVEVHSSDQEVLSQKSLSNVHSTEYIEHLKTIFDRFLEAGTVDQDGCILPECFPHRSLLESNHLDSEAQPKGAPCDAPHTTKRLRLLPKDPFAHLGYYSFDLSAGMSRHTFRSTLAAINLALIGVDMLLQESHPFVFALTRPPGHHSCHKLAGGYCYMNNAAIAADHLLEKLGTSTEDGGRSRVVILDLDFHHGNGTQSLTYAKREPAYISIHGEDEYPYYTGAEDERGIGEGEGYNCNLPLTARPNSNRDAYINTLDNAVNIIRTKWKPTYLIVSIGFDTFRKDPLGGFELDVDDYRTIGIAVGSLGVPVLALLEGGYSEELGDLVIRFLQGLQNK